MRLTDRQAHVLANIERVVPWPYKLNVPCRVTRYKLDGFDCTPQINGLVIRELIFEDEGKLTRRMAS